MAVLAFDTCFTACSVAVRAGNGARGGADAYEHVAMDTGHAEALIPMIGRVMAAAGCGFDDLERIVVTHGPGTFTGVRTGVAAARALALASGAGVIGVSSLWAIAVGALASAAEAEAVLAAMDARKGQVYAQVVDGQGRELTAPMLLEVKDAAALYPGLRLVAVGNAADVVIAASREAGRLIGRVGSGMDQADARALLAAADRTPLAEPLLPLYLRQPDAKPQADKSLPWSTP